MEFLLTEEELKKVEKLLPKIAKKHGLQCSFLECSKGAGSSKRSSGGKGKESGKAPKAKPRPSKKGVKRTAEPLESPGKRRMESSPSSLGMEVFLMPRVGSPVYPPSAAERACLDGLVEKLYELEPQEVQKVMEIYSSMVIDEGDAYTMDLDNMTRFQRRELLQMLEDRVFEQRRLVTCRSSFEALNDP